MKDRVTVLGHHMQQVHFPVIPYRAAYSWSRDGHSVDIRVIAPTATQTEEAEHIQHYLPHRNKILFTHFHVSACTYVRAEMLAQSSVTTLYGIRRYALDIFDINTNAFVLATVGPALNTNYLYI